MVHDVGEDQPSRPREVRADLQRLGQRRIVEGLHVAPQAGVLFEAERVDRREVVELEPVVPDVGIPNVVPQQSFAPAPVDVDEVAQGLEGAAVVEVRGPAELLIRQAGRRRQDPVVRPCVEPNEGEQAVCIHAAILGLGSQFRKPEAGPGVPREPWAPSTQTGGFMALDTEDDTRREARTLDTGVPQIQAIAAMPSQEVLDRRGTRASGLSTAEAEARLASFGPNAVRSHHTSAVAVWSGSCVARCSCCCRGGRRLGVRRRGDRRVIIGVIIAASVGLGFVNEYRAERAAEALHSRSGTSSRCSATASRRASR